jgi:DASS family divalent anion:Na+ symporter
MLTSSDRPPSGVRTKLEIFQKSSRFLGLLLAALAGLIIFLLPGPAGLSKPAQAILAITGFTVLMWMLGIMNNGVTAILMMGLMILTGAQPKVVLSGFSSPGLWILLCVLFYGFAMQSTGLAQRISYYILSLFPATYTGILAAFSVMGFILALGIPSMTVRTAIMVPIAWALVQSLGLAPRSKGSALIMLTTIEMAMIPGCAFLYGSLIGPIVENVFKTKNLPLSWLAYAQVVTAPTVVLCAILIAVNQIVLRPDVPLAQDRGFARRHLESLGPIKRAEGITIAVVLASILYWATDRFHHMPSFLVGMFGLAVFAFAGIVRDRDIGGGVSWTLLLFMGGIFGLANVLQEYKIPDWLAGYFVPVARQLTSHPAVLVVVLALSTYVMRFLDPSSLIALPLLFLPIADTVIAAGIPPLVIVAPLVIASVPFWLSYQNVWVVMGEGLTQGEGFTGSQRTLAANAYAVVTLIALLVGTVYWKWIGVL